MAHPDSKIARPREELKGFQRVSLGPNETKKVEISLDASTLAYWSEQDKKLAVEAEPLKLMIGDSSAALKLTTAVKVQ